LLNRNNTKLEKASKIAKLNKLQLHVILFQIVNKQQNDKFLANEFSIKRRTVPPRICSVLLALDSLNGVKLGDTLEKLYFCCSDFGGYPGSEKNILIT